MGEKRFLPTSTPRWHHAEGAFLGGLPCIGIIEIPIHEHIERLKAWQALDLPAGIELLVHQNRLLKIAREGGQMTPADLSKFELQRRY
ncbi:hypothetical protein, partial [Pseudomonas sp. ST1]